MINHPKLRVEKRNGAEGPKHDPYGYEEIHATVPGRQVILHQGLGTWLKVGPEKAPSRQLRELQFPYEPGHYEQHERACLAKFEELVGFTIPQLERMQRKLNERCRKCGSRGTHTEHGYPGEYLEVCDYCGHINGSYFCPSEIE